MEITYADEASGGGFKNNAIPELTELAVSNEDFSGADPGLNGGIVYPGSHNTMAAIFFTHFAGLPLKVDICINNMDTQKSFFRELPRLGMFRRKKDTGRYSCWGQMRHLAERDFLKKITGILRKLEHIQGHSKTPVKRIQANMRNAIKVSSYDPSKGKRTEPYTEISRVKTCRNCSNKEV